MEEEGLYSFSESGKCVSLTQLPEKHAKSLVSGLRRMPSLGELTVFECFSCQSECLDSFKGR